MHAAGACREVGAAGEAVLIERHFTADRLNSVLNHEAVRPWVANDSDGTLDLSDVISNQQNVCLMGEHGGCMFIKIAPGVYEVHTQVMPEGRGEWTRDLTEACVRFMFTRTDAYEITTRVPRGHIAAKAAAEAQGMRFEFTREAGVVFRNRLTDVHIYSFRIQDWVTRADYLIKTGEWLHRRMAEEAARLGISEPAHGDDENHNRYAGAALEMAFGGFAAKAVLTYNRWAVLARHATVQLLSVDPIAIRMDIGVLHVTRDADIRISRE